MYQTDTLNKSFANQGDLGMGMGMGMGMGKGAAPVCTHTPASETALLGGSIGRHAE